MTEPKFVVLMLSYATVVKAQALYVRKLDFLSILFKYEWCNHFTVFQNIYFKISPDKIKKTHLRAAMAALSEGFSLKEANFN